MQHMKAKGIDPSSYQDVMINAVQIYSRVKSGSMPPPGSGEQPWSDEWVNTFRLLDSTGLSAGLGLTLRGFGENPGKHRGRSACPPRNIAKSADTAPRG